MAIFFTDWFEPWPKFIGRIIAAKECCTFTDIVFAVSIESFPGKWVPVYEKGLVV